MAFFIYGGDPNGYDEGQKSEHERALEEVVQASRKVNAFQYSQIPECRIKDLLNANGFASMEDARKHYGVTD